MAKSERYLASMEDPCLDCGKRPYIEIARYHDELSHRFLVMCQCKRAENLFNDKDFHAGLTFTQCVEMTLADWRTQKTPDEAGVDPDEVWEAVDTAMYRAYKAGWARESFNGTDTLKEELDKITSPGDGTDSPRPSRPFRKP